MLNLSKKSIFKCFVTKKLMVAQKKFHAPGMMSDQFRVRFKIFPIVESTKLGGQKFKLGLYPEIFSLWIWEVIWNRYFKTLQNSQYTFKSDYKELILKIINSKIILCILFYQKRSFFTDLRSITWFFVTSYKKTYFYKVFRIFLARYHFKKIKNNKFPLNSTRTIDWCMNCHIWMIKKFVFLMVRVPLIVKK